MANRMNRFFVMSLVLLITLAPVSAHSQTHECDCCKDKTGTNPVLAQAYSWTPMPDPGKKILLGDDHYFLYGFTKKPAMGTVIMKVELFTKDGKRDTSMEIKADSGMPSMRGAHDTGDLSFKVSNKGDYLLPVNLVMPGEWEMRFTFLKEGKVIYRGSYKFRI